MKIVINTCFGGFSLSGAALRRIAELQGRECYFFNYQIRESRYIPITEDANATLGFTAFDIPNPNEIFGKQDWYLMSAEEREVNSTLYKKHIIDNRPEDRTDPLLIQVIEELGSKGNGRHAKLSVIEIPDDVEWEIDEYDGVETVREVHRSWS